eukprot:3279412-Pyramimonas_sp.AAC.1
MLNDMEMARSFAQQGQDLSNHKDSLSGATSRELSSRKGSFIEAFVVRAPNMPTAGLVAP